MTPDRPRTVALVDGEHYPPVVADALAALAGRRDVRVALLLGGSEKLRASPAAREYGVPVLELAGPQASADVSRLVAAHAATVVLDLSDEPVVSARSRLRLATAALAGGAAYEGPGFRFEPPTRLPYPLPALAIVGTGKRVGKTAVSGYIARLARDRLAASGERVVVVAMGRGGPRRPELVDPTATPLVAADLLRRSRAGAHAASDYLEDAVLAGVATVGCRRCGGGPAGEVGESNVGEGAMLAASLSPGLTIFEGSGAASPPVRCDRTLLVTAVRTDPEEVLGYLGPYRVATAHAVVVIGAEPGSEAALGHLVAGLREINPAAEIVPAVLRPRPSSPVAGRRVALFTTAPTSAHGTLRRHLEARHGAEVVAVCGALSDRPALRAALAEPAIRSADLLLTEIKAAAVDVVADWADQRGTDLSFYDNVPTAADGSDALERLGARLVDEARSPRGDATPPAGRRRP